VQLFATTPFHSYKFPVTAPNDRFASMTGQGGGGGGPVRSIVLRDLPDLAIVSCVFLTLCSIITLPSWLTWHPIDFCLYFSSGFVTFRRQESHHRSDHRRLILLRLRRPAPADPAHHRATLTLHQRFFFSLARPACSTFSLFA
jgi:hypothetical protein